MASHIHSVPKRSRLQRKNQQKNVRKTFLSLQYLHRKVSNSQQGKVPFHKSQISDRTDKNLRVEKGQLAELRELASYEFFPCKFPVKWADIGNEIIFTLKPFVWFFNKISGYIIFVGSFPATYTKKLDYVVFIPQYQCWQR